MGKSINIGSFRKIIEIKRFEWTLGKRPEKRGCFKES
jgi:hypothetical protein